MKTSDDAFGLLSLDWSGEPVAFKRSPVGDRLYAIAPPVNALYGKGLLRIWSDNIYSRVMAEHETPDSREAVISLGRAIVTNRKNPPGPRLLSILFISGFEFIILSESSKYFKFGCLGRSGDSTL
jgi:hypothetical protein